MASTTLPTRALTAAVFTLLAWAATPLTTLAQLPDYLPTEGLVGWWPFNGNANDESGNGNDGVVNGAILTSDRNGNPSTAYSFNGTPDRIELGNTFPNAAIGEPFSSWSASVWINRNSNSQVLGISDYNSIAGNNNPGENDMTFAVHLTVENSTAYFSARVNGVTFGLNGGFISSSSWHLIAFTAENNVLKLFVDGAEVGSTFYNSSLNYYEAPIYRVGSGMWNGNYGPSTGFIDDIAIYNRALTPEEITALFTGIPYVAPCADPTACNFEQEGECVFAEPNLDCAGNCLNDCNNNGVCDEVEVYGCEYPTACNYNPEANVGDGSCTFPDFGYDCAGNCLLDLNNNGLCDLEEVAGCTNIDAINYNADASLDDGSCMVTCKGDFDNDGQITINDLLGFLAAYGNQCAGAGCMDPAGCNYDLNATFDLGYCEYPLEFYACDGTPINDADGDGIPDELEVAGCTDPEAGNYNPDATDDNGSCTFGLTGSTHTCGAENVHNPDLVYGSVTDIDGNTYRTIVIGNQEWMAENLTVEHYANGDPISNVTSGGQWGGLSTGAWCYYNNDPQFECPYGKLYNWYTVADPRNVCPTGWHVPTDAEYMLLTDYLGGEPVAGGKMKSTGTQYWLSPNTAATNESGFSGLPGGNRSNNGSFYNIGNYGYWWSSTENGAGDAWDRYLIYNNGIVYRYNDYKENGFSVRCLRD